MGPSFEYFIAAFFGEVAPLVTMFIDNFENHRYHAAFA